VPSGIQHCKHTVFQHTEGAHCTWKAYLVKNPFARNWSKSEIAEWLVSTQVETVHPTTGKDMFNPCWQLARDTPARADQPTQKRVGEMEMKRSQMTMPTPMRRPRVLLAAARHGQQVPPVTLRLRNEPPKRLMERQQYATFSFV
jgi:hypothetical protein